jgi:hypothetical protein
MLNILKYKNYKISNLNTLYRKDIYNINNVPIKEIFMINKNIVLSGTSFYELDNN